MKTTFLSLLSGPFEPAVQKFPSNLDYDVPDADERRALLRSHLAGGGTINIRRYASLTHLTPAQAAKELKALAASGFLIPSGTSTHRIYLLAPE